MRVPRHARAAARRAASPAVVPAVVPAAASTTRVASRRAAPVALRMCAVLVALPLTTASAAGDPTRGEAIVRDRAVGLCLLCHSGPFPDERLQGNLAPSLAGAGSRWTREQLRARIEDSRRFVPDSIMPAYARRDGFVRPGKAYEGKPILDDAQIDDVVAFLATLR
jgi:sulfur-oxidizing protein SoxX